MSLFNDKVAKLLAGHEALLMRKNEPVEEGPIPPLPKTFDWRGGCAAGVPLDEAAA